MPVVHPGNILPNEILNYKDVNKEDQSPVTIQNVTSRSGGVTKNPEVMSVGFSAWINDCPAHSWFDSDACIHGTIDWYLKHLSKQGI